MSTIKMTISFIFFACKIDARCTIVSPVKLRTIFNSSASRIVYNHPLFYIVFCYCTSVGGHKDNQRTEGEVADVIAAGIPADDEKQDVIHCVICNKFFQSEKRKAKHVCLGGRAKHDMLTAALQYAHDRVDTGSVSFVSVVREQQDVGETIVSSDLDFDGCLSDFEATLFPRSWARRDDTGNIYGAKYIDDYK